MRKILIRNHRTVKTKNCTIRITVLYIICLCRNTGIDQLMGVRRNFRKGGQA